LFYTWDQLATYQNSFDKIKKGRELTLPSLYAVSFLSNQVKKSNTFDRKASERFSKMKDSGVINIFEQRSRASSFVDCRIWSFLSFASLNLKNSIASSLRQFQI